MFNEAGEIASLNMGARNHSSINFLGGFIEGMELLEGDKSAVCDTCSYRVAKSWKSGKAIQEQLLKRKHPISPLSSNQGDKETERVISGKKSGHRLPFDYSTAAWLVQLVEHQTAVREVEGSSPRLDQHSGS